MDIPLPAAPSPKFHAHEVMLPSGSEEAAPERPTGCPVVAAWLAPAFAIGGRLLIVTVAVSLPDRPPASLTVSVTGYVPATAYACDADTPLPDEPSPKLHAYDTIVPSGSNEPLPSKLSMVNVWLN